MYITISSIQFTSIFTCKLSLTSTEHLDVAEVTKTNSPALQTHPLDLFLAQFYTKPLFLKITSIHQ